MKNTVAKISFLGKMLRLQGQNDNLTVGSE
jgi:hypothetical protein